jgi:hypothetical protein
VKEGVKEEGRERKWEARGREEVWGWRREGRTYDLKNIFRVGLRHEPRNFE